MNAWLVLLLFSATTNKFHCVLYLCCWRDLFFLYFCWFFFFFYLMLYVPTYKHIRNVKECRKAKQTFIFGSMVCCCCRECFKEIPKTNILFVEKQQQLQGKKVGNKNRQKKGSEKFYCFLLLFSKSWKFVFIFFCVHF